jgi:hypothetical protein
MILASYGLEIVNSLLDRLENLGFNLVLWLGYFRDTENRIE